MNDKTKYEILRRREMTKGYNASDAEAEPTDQEQKLPFPMPLKEAKGTEILSL